MEVYNINIENECDKIFLDEFTELKKETSSMESTHEFMEQEENKYSDIEEFFNEEECNNSILENNKKCTLNEQDEKDQNSFKKEDISERGNESFQGNVNIKEKQKMELNKNNSTVKETLHENKKEVLNGSTYQQSSSQSDGKGRNITQKKNSLYSSDNYTYYQFSDDEIRFCPDDNTANQIYSPESSYTGSDFKNCLCWIPRSLKIEDSPSTDSIPCAFFCANENNQINHDDNIIVYLHKFNEDLGIAMPTVYALHKKLKMHVIAMEYSGYGVSYDTFENKNISIVNDLYLILKFVAAHLQVPYNNIYIICSEFLASCVIEAINWFESNEESKTTLGGAILIKPEFLEICNGINGKPDITFRTNRKSKDDQNNDTNEKGANEPVKDDLFDPESEESVQGYNTVDNLKNENEKQEQNPNDDDDDAVSNIEVAINEYVKEQEEITEKEKLKRKMKQNGHKNKGDNVYSSNYNEKNTNKIGKNQQQKKETSDGKINKKKRKSIFYRSFNIFKKKNSFENKQIEAYTNNICSMYHDYNGITACDMSLFYSNDMKDTDEINKIPFLLFKRILKDTFDINHVKNSIQEITCPFLIFHQESSSYKNSCSNILLNNANKCLKKAAFTFDFMNEDFLNIFKWFFSDNCDTKEDDKFFKGMLFLYVHPQHNDPMTNCVVEHQMDMNNYEIENENQSRNRKNKNNKVWNSIINDGGSLYFPKQFFISPEKVIKSMNENYNNTTDNAY